MEEQERALNSKIIEWNEVSDVKQMWEWVKQVAFDSLREMFNERSENWV